MKTFFLSLYLVMAACSITACSKDDGGGDSPSSKYYFKATVGGRKIDFHSVIFQGGGNDDKWEHIVVGGVETSYSTSGGPLPPSLDFEIWRLGSNIGPGAYVNPVEPNMIARYAIQHPDGSQVYNTSYSDDAFTVNIEAISKSGIKGTFSGTVRSLAGEAISITEGSFDLPYETLVNP